ncbi:NAD(P)H-binding protein [Blastopirellula marina]|uniref:Oxidoreductase n=1 Tax=Blastopirellula marina TaxID=124 RepID=A0A2S8GP88_9BACT|nr:NAD(P)H-binding protein [Blastopirellula marina]PQO46237.1 oxidoreductase [Blastopirellula marina]
MSSESPTSSSHRKSVLVTGATGYIGSRLIPRLLPQHDVRCLVRDADRLDPAVRDHVRTVTGDVLHTASLRESLEGIDVAYYLIHGLGQGSDFEKIDRKAAEGFAKVAREANVSRIIYLGGLGDENDPGLSPHLKSRQEVGRIFRESGVPTIELRASIVIGPGSLSYEMIRALTHRLPVMICPSWLATPTQPIATEDALIYLMEALEVESQESDVIEIGSDDVVTYGDLIKMYAREKDLKRVLITVPLLTPYLSSLWLGLVTPNSAEVGRHLIEGLRNPTVVRNGRSRDVFAHRPMSTADAIRQAVEIEP